MKKINQKSIPKSEGKLYLSKASDFYKSMELNMIDGNWNGVGLAGVHCAISSCDAILAHLFGIRHTSPDHKAAAELLSSKIGDENSRKNSERFRKILDKKNLNEYLSKSFNKTDALAIEKDVERFYSWAKGLLK